MRGGRRSSAIETFFFFASLGDEVATLWTNFDLSHTGQSLGVTTVVPQAHCLSMMSQSTPCT